MLLFFAFTSQNSEADLKFGTLTKLLHFVDWPNQMEEKSDTFNFAVYKYNPFPEASLFYEKNQKIKGKSFHLEIVQDVLKLDNFLVLYVPGKYKNDIETLMKVKPQHLLIVSDQEGCLEEGAMLNFLIKRNAVQFEINKKQIKSNGFILNSKLYKLGVVK